MTVFNVLAPVFLLIALGAALVRTRFVSEAFLRETNRVTYWLGLPALLFTSLAASFHDASASKALLLTLVAATFAVVALAYVACVLLKLPFASYGTFVQASFRGNLAYVGLPIIYALPAVSEGLRAAVTVAIAPMLVLYNCVAVVALIASQHKLELRTLKPLLKQLATTPPLLATLAGIGWAVSGWHMPHAIYQSLEWLGQMALPLALLGIGGALARSQTGREWKAPSIGALLKIGVGPALGWLLAPMFGLSHIETVAAALLLACPTAGISYTMVTQLRGDEELASATILLSTVGAVASLAVVVSISG
ncbi:AEC family transporter [Nibricoccus sp. IMCC34717]|uniref:AEC family transporter n=1 Tax=Nibricoccus sp. IMCC34717 TaxID=3034021 RepID=UPI00384C00AB